MVNQKNKKAVFKNCFFILFKGVSLIKLGQKNLFNIMNK